MSDKSDKRYKMYLREIKEINKRERYYVHGSDDLILLRHHFSKNWSIYVMQF